MYIETVPNRNSRPAVLLREGWREGKKVKKRTLANLSDWPQDKIDALRMALSGVKLMALTQALDKRRTRTHGHVDLVLKTVKHLGLDKMVSAKPCRERNIIVATIVARVCAPDSKLAMTRWWKDTTLPELLDLDGVDEDDIYEAMDWLLARQRRIEKKLAKRHLREGDLVLYDLSSSYFEGETCPLAKRGKSRDRKRNTLQVNYGLVATQEGCPVSVSVYEGNTGDSTTLMEQVHRVRDDFGIHEVVLVGDRGMITQRQIDQLRDMDDIAWITALKTGGIRKLVEGGALQLDLFDERNLFELTSPDYPGERLVACRNAALGRKRGHKRMSMLEATEGELSKIRKSLERGTLKKTERSKERIGLRVGKVINKYKMAKHFVLQIQENRFDFDRNEQSIANEAVLDGLYVIRTSVSADKMDAAESVRSYKMLTSVERAFKSLKGVDLMVRPIRHRTENRVRAHVFLCMLTYYVQRYMKEALRPMLFADDDLELKATRDPVAPAKRSSRASKKAATKQLEDGVPVESFRTLLHHMSTITRDTFVQQLPNGQTNTFDLDTRPDIQHQKVYARIAEIPL
jgi:transposase